MIDVRSKCESSEKTHATDDDKTMNKHLKREDLSITSLKPLKYNTKRSRDQILFLVSFLLNFLRSHVHFILLNILTIFVITQAQQATPIRSKNKSKNIAVNIKLPP